MQLGEDTTLHKQRVCNDFNSEKECMHNGNDLQTNHNKLSWFLLAATHASHSTRRTFLASPKWTLLSSGRSAILPVYTVLS